MRRFLLITCVVLAVASVAGADVLTMVTTRPAGDIVNWNNFGPAGTPVPSGSVILSNGGISVTVTTDNQQPLMVMNQLPCAGWDGNFSPCDPVLWNQGNQGIMTFTFGAGVNQVGAQIQANAFGDFRACAQAFGSFGASAIFCENGTSNPNADGSAIYLGIADFTGFNITSFTIWTPITFALGEDYAVNQMTLNGAVPEPASLVLMGTGLLALARKLRKT